MTNAAMLRRFFAVVAALAAMVLGLVVIIGEPTNSLDLLGGIGVASGAGALVLLL